MGWKLRLENFRRIEENVTKSRREIIGIKSVSKIYNLGDTIVAEGLKKVRPQGKIKPIYQ